MGLTYYRSLDGVRGIAALMIMVFHFFQEVEQQTGVVGMLKKLSVFGRTGVTLFFVLSGFLITRILLHTKETPGYFRNFYGRRAVRIFPLYYLFLLIYYYLVPAVEGSASPALSDQLYYYFYLQNFAETFGWEVTGPLHFWSLAVEEHFYLFWPLVVYLVTQRRLLKIIVAIVVMALLLRMYMVGSGYSVFYFTFTRFGALAIGSGLALLETNGYLKPARAKYFSWLLLLVVAPLIALWMAFTGAGNDNIQLYKYPLIALVYFSAIGYLITQRTPYLNEWLRAGWLSYTGRISYGLYVYHPLLFLLCAQYLHLGNIVLDFALSTALCYLVASASYYYFEAPFLGLKRFFAYGNR